MKGFYKGIHKTYLKVGLVSLIIIISFIVSYAWLTNRLNSGTGFELRILFEDVGGLEIGDKVSYRGMEVGRIKDVKISPQGIVCTARLKEKLELPLGTRFYVADSSLMGGKLLTIEPGSGSTNIDYTALQKGSSSTGLMAIVAEAQPVIRELKSVLEDLRADNGLLASGAGFVSEARGTLAKLDSSVDKAQPDLLASLKKMNIAMGKIDEFLNNNSADLEAGISGLAPLMLEAKNSLDSLQVLTAQLSKTVNAVNKGSGTANKLVYDDDVYLQMQSTLSGLEALIADIKANPRKYIKFSVF